MTIVQFPMTARVDIEIAPVVDDTAMKEGSDVVSDYIPAYVNAVEGEAHEAVAEKGLIANVDAVPGWATKVFADWVTGVIVSLLGVDEQVHQESMLAKEVVTMSTIEEVVVGLAPIVLDIVLK